MRGRVGRRLTGSQDPTVGQDASREAVTATMDGGAGSQGTESAGGRGRALMSLRCLGEEFNQVTEPDLSSFTVKMNLDFQNKVTI